MVFAKASRLVSQFWTKAEVNSTNFSVAVILLYFHDFFPACSVFLSAARVFQKRILCMVSVLTLKSEDFKSELNLFGIM